MLGENKRGDGRCYGSKTDVATSSEQTRRPIARPELAQMLRVNSKTIQYDLAVHLGQMKYEFKLRSLTTPATVHFQNVSADVKIEKHPS
jgi:hypothetical protein